MLTETVCVALSGAGLAIAVLTAWRRRFLAATRAAAVALLPIGLYLTGLLTLVGRVGRAIGSWGAGLVLRPSVWLGFAVLAVSVVLYAAARLAAGRSGGGRAARKAARAAEGGTQVGAGPAAELGGGRRAAAPTTANARQPKRGKRDADDPLSEFGDIEEILRKRGI